MKNKMVFIISFIGALGGIAAAIVSGITEPVLPPAFNPAASPYPSAIYAEGIVESAQTSGVNINIYPEVAGTVKEILVSEGQQVKAGQPLLRIDDSIQRATTEQQGSQAEAAEALLEELKAQPRKENLDVADAQVAAAEATLKTAQDTLQKDQAAYEIDPRSVSKDALDSALNAAAVAKANLIVAQKQDDLTRASLDLRHPKSGTTAARLGKGLCSLWCAARQVYPASIAGWRCARHQYYRRELCVPAGVL